MGRETVLALAKHNPGHVYFTGRSATKAREVISLAQASSAAGVSFIPCDLSSMAAAKTAADSFLAQSPDRLDVLICNAGIMGASPQTTKDGYECHFAINHLAHALLIQLLLATIQNTPGGRIVSLASLAFMFLRQGGIQFETIKTSRNLARGAIVSTAMQNYAHSKLAIILYTQELARRYPNVKSVSVHPGSVTTPLVTELGWADWLLIRLTSIGGFISPEQGAYTQLWAATTPLGNLTSGAYYEPVGEKGHESKFTKDIELAKKLYDWTETELQSYLH